MHANPPVRHLGQSTVECTIMLATLVPVILVFAHLGRIADIRHATLQASQFAVWDQALVPWRTGEDSQSRAQELFFSHAGSPYTTRAQLNSVRHYWVDHSGSPLFAPETKARLVLSRPGFGEARRVFDVAGRPFLHALDLPADGLIHAQAHIDVLPLRSPALAPFDTMPIPVAAQSALLSEGWAASSPADIRRRLDDWRITVPDPLLTPLVRALAQMFHSIGLEADPDSFRNRNIDPDVTPCDVQSKEGRSPC